jgi:NTP pyrophosphatase (non-canonical NTP hydrolase)
MEIDEMQKQIVELINKIDEKYENRHDIDITLIHLIEEFGEIARERYNEKMGRDKLNKQNLEEEIADCFMLLTKLADNYDIDLKKAIDNKIGKLKQRHKL